MKNSVSGSVHLFTGFESETSRRRHTVFSLNSSLPGFKGLYNSSVNISGVLKKEEQFFWKILKKYFSQFQSIFGIPVGQRWRWRWRWRWKIFHGEMLRKWNGIVPTYVEAAKKILGNIPNVKFFRADTYFGGTQNLGQPEKHFFDTFFQFRPWRGPKCDQNQLWHVNIAGNLH